MNGLRRRIDDFLHGFGHTEKRLPFPVSVRIAIYRVHVTLAAVFLLITIILLDHRVEYMVSFNVHRGKLNGRLVHISCIHAVYQLGPEPTDDV